MQDQLVWVYGIRGVAHFLHPAHQPRSPWSRVDGLIDGPFGFAATVLMVRLVTPAYEEGDLGVALAEQAPYYLLYAFGFIQIIAAWSVMRLLCLDAYAFICIATFTAILWPAAGYGVSFVSGWPSLAILAVTPPPKQRHRGSARAVAELLQVGPS